MLQTLVSFFREQSLAEFNHDSRNSSVLGRCSAFKNPSWPSVIPATGFLCFKHGAFIQSETSCSCLQQDAITQQELAASQDFIKLSHPKSCEAAQTSEPEKMENSESGSFKVTLKIQGLITHSSSNSCFAFGYCGKAIHLFLQKAGLLDCCSNAAQCVGYRKSQMLVMWVKGYERNHEIHAERLSGSPTSG